MIGGRYTHPEDWRWDHDSYYTRHPTIDIIEPPKGDAERKGRRVPFGFARELVDSEKPQEPQLWEGDQA